MLAGYHRPTSCSHAFLTSSKLVAEDQARSQPLADERTSGPSLVLSFLLCCIHGWAALGLGMRQYHSTSPLLEQAV